MSLPQVFRTNASYARWDEARKMWGLMLNRSRDLMRMGCTMMPDHEVERKKALGRWIIASARSLKLHFQPEVRASALCFFVSRVTAAMLL
jgi:predicted membrane chloride channel (bestrophin family)